MTITEKLAKISEISNEGVSFVKLRFFMEDMEKRSLEGDEAAKKLVDIADQYYKLIKYVDTL